MSLYPFIRTLVLSEQDPTCITSFKLNHLLKDPIASTASWGRGGRRALTHEFQGTCNSVHGILLLPYSSFFLEVLILKKSCSHFWSVASDTSAQLLRP